MHLGLACPDPCVLGPRVVSVSVCARCFHAGLVSQQQPVSQRHQIPHCKRPAGRWSRAGPPTVLLGLRQLPKLQQREGEQPMIWPCPVNHKPSDARPHVPDDPAGSLSDVVEGLVSCDFAQTGCQVSAPHLVFSFQTKSRAGGAPFFPGSDGYILEHRIASKPPRPIPDIFWNSVGSMFADQSLGCPCLIARCASFTWHRRLSWHPDVTHDYTIHLGACGDGTLDICFPPLTGPLRLLIRAPG